ncbi:thiamine diphosphokinase [Petrotoga sp. 9PW.55.5.1]|uniref:thiamine diphosphokinase n=1 Tax=Petrotoga sp. 9PW.55.5.1 TaxID=1308979 RepID=UPI000DD5388E|nr:thiamine diphosphokinase [Petrotoga sp. 9PW.55.5.1]
MKKIIYIISGAGQRSSLNFYKQMTNKASLTIACDSGIEIFKKINFPPNYLMGDFDSAKTEDILWAKENGTIILDFPKEKDEIDTELALIFLRKEKKKDVILSGVLGNRIDQELANIFLLAEYIDLNPIIFEEDIKIGVVNKKVTEEAIPEESWSILRIGEPVYGLTLKGFKYSLYKKNLDNFKSLGISNYAAENQVEISVDNGIVIYIRWINKRH